MLRLLGLLLALLVAAPHCAVSAEDRPLRLVTFNLLHGGPWSSFTGEDAHLERRLAMIVDDLRALDADVVALQEVPVTRRHGDVAARLAGALGFYHVHARATERVFPVMRLLGRLITAALGFVEGPAILSRFPILTTEIHDLPPCRRWLDARVVLRADVATPAGTLAVFSTHTSRDDCQLRRVAELVGARRGPLPAIVAGDFNTRENADAYAELLGAGFVDAFRAVNPGAAGSTSLQRVYAAESTVSRRIDFVFVVSGVNGAARVRESRVVLDIPRRRADGTTLWPSDHYGVLAVIEIPTNRAN